MSQERGEREIQGSLGALLGFSLPGSHKESSTVHVFLLSSRDVVQEHLTSSTLSSINPIRRDCSSVLLLAQLPETL